MKSKCTPTPWSLWAVIRFEEITDAGLERLNKGSSVAVNIEAMEILKELGIRVIGDFIVSPEYSEADFKALDGFVSSHAIDLPIPSILTPLPGTPLHRKLAERIVVRDLDYYTFTNAQLTAEAIRKRPFFPRVCRAEGRGIGGSGIRSC